MKLALGTFGAHMNAFAKKKADEMDIEALGEMVQDVDGDSDGCSDSPNSIDSKDSPPTQALKRRKKAD